MRVRDHTANVHAPRGTTYLIDMCPCFSLFTVPVSETAATAGPIAVGFLVVAADVAVIVSAFVVAVAVVIVAAADAVDAATVVANIAAMDVSIHTGVFLWFMSPI